MKPEKSSKNNRAALGKQGEQIACDYLMKHGYRIMARNYRCPLGEIDLIAKKQKKISFIEIKTRTQTRYGRPEEAVDTRKQYRIIRIAQWYLKEHQQADCRLSFDVLSLFKPEGDAPAIRFIEGAFEAPAGMG